MAKMKMTRLKGLQSIEIKDAEATGDVWTELGETALDTFTITKSEDSVTEEFIEESEDPVEVIVTQKGVREFSWSTKNVAAELFQAIAGGKIEGDVWKEDTSIKPKIVSIRATSSNGIVATISRAQLSFSGDMKFTRNSLTQLTIKAKQLGPKAGEAGFQIEYPTA